MLTLKPQWQFMRITRLLSPCLKIRSFTEGQKHVDIKCHFVRDQVHKGSFNIFYCPTSNMLADLFTKGLPKGQFRNLRELVVLHTSHPKLFNYNKKECWKRHCYWTISLCSDVNLFWCHNVLWQIRHHLDRVLNSPALFFAIWLTRCVQFFVVSGNLDFY